MDPISVLGTAIAVSSLVKEIIKLAEQIKRSIDKARVPQNRKNLRKLTADIAKILTELEQVYDGNKDVLDRSDKLHMALSDLSKHMHEVDSRCQALTVPSANNQIRKWRAAFKAWYNCNAIEAEILMLKDEVNTVSTRFMMFALARIEKPIVDTAATISRMDPKLDVLNQQQQQGLRQMEGFEAKLDVYTQIKTTTTKPQSVLQITSETPKELYLHDQIKDITSSLGDLRAFSSEEPRGSYLEPFKPDVLYTYGANLSPTKVHHVVVAAIHNIIEILQGPPGELSVQNGAWEMVNLAIRLRGLEMYSEAKNIGSWTVDLYRALWSTNAQVYEPYLVLALRNLSRYKMDIKDYEGAVEDIEECVIRGRDMLKKPSKHNVHPELSNSLIDWWSIVTQDGKLGGGLEIAQESLALLEDIRAELEEWEVWSSSTVDGTSSSESIAAKPEETDSDTLSPQLSNSIQGRYDASTLWFEYNRARTYHSLSYSLEDAGRIAEAYDRELQALTIFRSLFDQCPGIFDDRLARCLTHLASAPLSNNLHPSAPVECMQESVQLYRKLFASRPSKFTSSLIESLWDCATLLHDTGKVDAAKQCSAEALELTRKSNNDRLILADVLRWSSLNLQRLEQHDLALTTRREIFEICRDSSNNHTADLLCDLAYDHIAVGQTEDATAACTEAVRRYRLIRQLSNNSVAQAALAKGLSCLTHIHSVAKQPGQALMAGSEAQGLYRPLIADDPNLVQPYLSTLRRVGICAQHGNEVESIKIHAEVLKDLRILAIHYPDHVKWKLVDAFHAHDYILFKHKRTHEAHRNTGELVGHIRAMPLDSSEVLSKLITALLAHAGSYAELGRVGEALHLCEEAIAIGEKYPAEADDSEIGPGLSDAHSMHSQWLRDSGRYDEALHASRAALDIYHRHPRDDTTILACRLHEYAINLRHANRLPEAIDVAEDAVRLCRSSSSTTTFVNIRLPYILETLSTAVAEAGDEERAFVIIQDATDLYRKIKSNSTITEPWVFAETLYANALVNLSSQLAARGKWEEAEAAVSEATAIYKSRVDFASAYYPHLTRALDLTSIQLCAAGRHEEAIQAANDKKRHLGVVDPEVTRLVGVALSELQGRSSRVQSALRQKYLQCTRCSSADMIN